MSQVPFNLHGLQLLPSYHDSLIHRHFVLPWGRWPSPSPMEAVPEPMLKGASRYKQSENKLSSTCATIWVYLVLESGVWTTVLASWQLSDLVTRRSIIYLTRGEECCFLSVNPLPVLISFSSLRTHIFLLSPTNSSEKVFWKFKDFIWAEFKVFKSFYISLINFWGFVRDNLHSSKLKKFKSVTSKGETISALVKIAQRILPEPRKIM